MQQDTQPTRHDTLHEALAAVQANLPHVGLDAEGHHRNKYASLPSVNAALLPLLAEHGLTWTCIVDVDQTRMVGRLGHGPTGEVVTTEWPLPNSKDPQAIGSAMTYGRRYLICALTGLAPDDGTEDDGNLAAEAARSGRDDRDDRQVVADLVLEHVPHDHHAALFGAYEQGATTLDEVEDQNVQRMRRALSSRASRARVLEGVARVVEESDDSDDEDGDGGAQSPPAGDADDDGTSGPAEPRAPETATQDDPDPHPQTVLAEVYPDLNVGEVSALVRKGEVTVRIDGRDRHVDLTDLDIPDRATIVERLEGRHHDPARKTVIGIVSAVLDPDDADGAASAPPASSSGEATVTDADDRTAAEQWAAWDEMYEDLLTTDRGRASYLRGQMFQRTGANTVADAEAAWLQLPAEVRNPLIRHAERILEALASD